MSKEFKKIKNDLLNIYLKIEMAVGDEIFSAGLLAEVEEDIGQKKLRRFFVPRLADVRRGGK
ncbi:MAG: hypothetical protein SCK29_11105 [Bacillota bacterium]|nr:hypothetical protein [Bacillota bacterium]MDW7684652.1 hypothetical protein [Bacillota bacterium]